MKSDDLQRYMDGSLDDAERSRLEEAMNSDPRAKQAAEGLGAFVAAVRRASLSEPVPHGRLNAALKAAAGPKKASFGWGQAGLLAGAAAACALGFMWFSSLPDSRISGNTILAASSSEAVDVLARADTVRVPPLNLEEVGQYRGATFDQSHVNMSFEVEGQAMTLTVSANDPPAPGASAVEVAGRTLFDDGGMCWKCPLSSYRLTGGTPELRQRVAGILLSQTGYSTRRTMESGRTRAILEGGGKTPCSQKSKPGLV